MSPTSNKDPRIWINCFSCMCSEKVILYKKWIFLFFAPLRLIFLKSTLLNIFLKFHLKTFLFKKISPKFVFHRFRFKKQKLKKNCISGPDFRSKNCLAEMALYTMSFVIKLSKRCELFFENSDAFFGKLTFCEFHIFQCPAHKKKLKKKKFKFLFFFWKKC